MQTQLTGKMHRLLIMSASLGALMAAYGCSNAASTPLPPVQAVETAPARSSADEVIAEVEVQPARTAELAFLIDGRVREVLVSEGDEVKAGQQLIVLEAPALEFALVSAQAEADSAELNQLLQSSSRQYKVWNGRRWIWTRGLPEVRRAADARFEAASGSLQVARAELAQASLLAPYDGTVISIDVTPGEMTTPSEPVAVFADLEHMQIVTTDLSERDIARVRVGQTARITLKAIAEELTGRVVAIDPFADRLESGDVVYRVTIELEMPAAELYWGMTGEAFIDVSS